MVRLLCLAIGYLFGLFQTSYIYGRLHGIDIREHGSGNAGTTNALRTLGLKAGLITFAGDCLKCILAVVTVRLLFGQSHAEYIRLLGLYAAAGTILGHNFPCYLKFRGGKGIAATAGLIISFDWRLLIAGIVVFFTTFFITHYVSLGSMLVYVMFMGGTVLLGQLGYFEMEPGYLYEMYAVAAFLTAMAVYRHRANIVRLVHGNENKTYLSSKHKK
ncbi:glycerol-3-phosphate 1-O-acyltransferase PlsY [Ruminococcus sp. OA3]|uniref:glycerol-3-phosphate 1-O-acyltransferase PlsY n=1 Tax=Ruminococcus sp. OA3 TaxID=2914164 RepID=UPI001F06C0C6|nr:glycerol-3-phosphate 1-O-acyltransferase PlsY [Ruminococcus sp. OA3]MCH1983673.1 glycerol-3-phosphate 1-O-acyltransferase PlsY [Ruminococcus sp. OA3]